MNQKIIIGVLAVSLMIGGCTGTKTGNGVVGDRQEGGENGLQKSLKEIMAGGQAQKCTVKMQSEEEGGLESEIWIKGKKMKQITKSEALGGGGEEMTIYVISDGEWIYNWNNKTNQGIKMKVGESEKQDQEAKENFKGSAVDWDKKIDYDCKVTSVADSEFAPPASIKFVDWAAEAAGMQEKIEEQLKKLEITGVPESEEE